MAFSDKNKFYGGYVEGLYKYAKPQISVTLRGRRNDGGTVGFSGGHTGALTQIFESNETYESIGRGNFIIGVTTTDRPDHEPFWESSYLTSIKGNYGRIGKGSGVDKINRREGGNFRAFDHTTDISSFVEIDCGLCKEQRREPNGDIVYTGGKTDFYLELTANCPIIKLTVRNYKAVYTAKDGSLKEFKNTTDISDVAEYTILNKTYSEPPKPTIKYYINNTWANGDTTTSKNFIAESHNKTSLCLYVDDSDIDTLDTSLNYSGGDDFTKIEFNGVSYDTIPDDAIKYTYNSKFGVYVSEFATNIPIFKSLEDVTEYLNIVSGGGDSDSYIKDNAINADDALTSNDNAQSGYDINTTPLEVGYSRNVFNKLFSLDIGAISEISGNLFNADTSVVDAITQGLKLYGANPMDCIIDLSYYPFDVNKVVDTTSQKQIFFGSYMMALENDVNMLGRPRTVIDMGEVRYVPVFNDFRDYEPYSQLYIYLPYCGFHKLDISNYYNRSISLKYIVDFTSGECIAVVSSDGIIKDSFNGTIGVHQTISSIDYNAYSQNVVKKGVDAIKSGVGAVLPIATGIKANNAFAGIKPQNILNGVVDFGMGTFDVYQNINAQHISIRGAGSASANMCLPQYAFTYCIYNKQIRPSNELELVGYPSNYGGKVKDFKGFLKCSKVSLNTTATVAEKRQIYELLQNGIYIN